MYMINKVYNCTSYPYMCVIVIPVQVGLERESYSVGENVGDNNLALLVCAVTSTDVPFGFTVTVSLQNGSAIGKNY